MHTILHRIKEGLPVSFSRFNDGEVGAIMGDLRQTSRGMQAVTPQLVERLKEALYYRADGYYIGIPCPECYPKYYNYVKVQLNGYENQILSVSVSNNHYHLFKNEFLSLIYAKNVAIVTEKPFEIGLKSVTFYICSPENADDEVKETLAIMGDHDYYILTVGAASRYMAMRLHQKGKNALDLGSIFDPEKGNKLLKAHNWPFTYKNAQKHCPICNY